MSDTPAIEPTLHELADLAEVLGDPLHHSLVLLEMIRDDDVDGASGSEADSPNGAPRPARQTDHGG